MNSVILVNRVRRMFFACNLKKVQLSCRHTSSSQRLQEDLILQNTVITQDHLTPEMKLRLITPKCELYHCKASESKFSNDPFWGIYWPGGQALGRFVLDHKKLFRGKNIIDIGSGCGACAIAAALSGARNVVANDIDPLSLAAITVNANLNNVKVYKCQNNLIGQEIDNLNIEDADKVVSLEFDFILVGDMFYDTEFSTLLFTWLSGLVKRGKYVLIGDPGRYALKDLEQLKHVGAINKVKEYELKNREHNGFTSTSVYKVGNKFKF